MTLGQRLFQYRNSINMSQERLAEKIGVTRQTISKWETDQSTPDFDKIVPLCETFGISTEELIKGEKPKIIENTNDMQDEYAPKRNKRKAIILSISIFLYCIATFCLPYMVEVLRYEDAHAVMIWATLCAIATAMIIYFFVAYPNKNKANKKEITEDIEELNNEIEEIEKLNDDIIRIKAVDTKNKTEALVVEIIATFFLVIYLIVSFLTMAWHITWILWVVFALVELIVKLIFSMKEEKSKYSEKRM